MTFQTNGKHIVESFDSLCSFCIVEFAAHSQHFVDPITRYHTRNSERKWGELKAVIREKKGIHDKQLNSHIAEFLWRERYGKIREVFYNFWSHVVELYPCN